MFKEKVGMQETITIYSRGHRKNVKIKTVQIKNKLYKKVNISQKLT